MKQQKSHYFKWGLTVFLTVCAILAFYDTFYMNGTLQRYLSKLVTVLTGYQKSTLCVCTDAEAEPALCVEKRQEHQHAVLLTHIAEKDFTYSGEMNLSRMMLYFWQRFPPERGL